MKYIITESRLYEIILNYIGDLKKNKKDFSIIFWENNYGETIAKSIGKDIFFEAKFIGTIKNMFLEEPTQLLLFLDYFATLLLGEEPESVSTFERYE